MLATDGVFSMDGDVAPLRDLALVARVQHAMLYVDDAHGVGVLGPEGRGSVAAAQPRRGAGAAAAGRRWARRSAVTARCWSAMPTCIEHLSETARPYIYTTALPPALAAASLAAVTLARREHWRREKLRALIARFRDGAAARGLPLLPSDTPIQPVLFGDDARAVALARSARSARASGSPRSARRPCPKAGAPAHHAECGTCRADVDGLLDALAWAWDVVGTDAHAATRRMTRHRHARHRARWTCTVACTSGLRAR